MQCNEASPGHPYLNPCLHEALWLTTHMFPDDCAVSIITIADYHFMRRMSKTEPPSQQYPGFLACLHPEHLVVLGSGVHPPLVKFVVRACRECRHTVNCITEISEVLRSVVEWHAKRFVWRQKERERGERELKVNRQREKLY